MGGKNPIYVYGRLKVKFLNDRLCLQSDSLCEVTDFHLLYWLLSQEV